MSEPRGRRSWQDTLSELGLEDETPSPPPVPAKPPARAEAPAPIPEPPPLEPEPEEPPSARGPRESSRDLPPLEEPIPAENAETAAEEEPGATDLAAAGEAVPDGEETSEKGGPRKRRRRRRRGGRGDRPEPEAGAPSVPGAEPTGDGDNSLEPPEKAPEAAEKRQRPREERPERADRSRRRRREEPVAAAAEEVTDVAEEPEVIEGVQPRPAAEDEALETPSDWNVPSWQEIIASLYRPDR